MSDWLLRQHLKIHFQFNAWENSFADGLIPGKRNLKLKLRTVDYESKELLTSTQETHTYSKVKLVLPIINSLKLNSWNLTCKNNIKQCTVYENALWAIKQERYISVCEPMVTISTCHIKYNSSHLNILLKI